MFPTLCPVVLCPYLCTSDAGWRRQGGIQAVPKLTFPGFNVAEPAFLLAGCAATAACRARGGCVCFRCSNLLRFRSTQSHDVHTARGLYECCLPGPRATSASWHVMLCVMFSPGLSTRTPPRERRLLAFERSGVSQGRPLEHARRIVCWDAGRRAARCRVGPNWLTLP